MKEVLRGNVHATASTIYVALDSRTFTIPYKGSLNFLYKQDDDERTSKATSMVHVKQLGLLLACTGSAMIRMSGGEMVPPLAAPVAGTVAGRVSRQVCG